MELMAMKIDSENRMKMDLDDSKGESKFQVLFIQVLSFLSSWKNVPTAMEGRRNMIEAG
jgi:hypothetical protein